MPQDQANFLFPLGWMPLLPLLGALLAGTLGRKISKETVGVICTLTVFGAFLLSLRAVLQILNLGGILGEGANQIWQSGQAILHNPSPYTWIAAGGLKIE